MLSRESMVWIRVGAILGGLSVIFGAFAAHGLEDYLLSLYGGMTREIMGETIPAARKYLADFKTAAEYQMYHALALVALGLMPNTTGRLIPRIAAWSFFVGTVVFSGSLYVLVLTGQRWFGAITPIGGVLFIVGWIALACSPWCPLFVRDASPLLSSATDEEDTYIVRRSP